MFPSSPFAKAASGIQPDPSRDEQPDSAHLSRRQILHSSLALVGLALWPWSRSSSPETGSRLDRITFGTSWYAEAEHGGFYQALATGIYARYGLDVTIKMGGPTVNILQLLVGGAVDFAMGSSIDVLAALASGIPVTTVAAMFQKDPQCLLAHPGVGHDRLEDLRGTPILVSQGANLGYWPFLRSRYGFTDDQKRPYNSNLAPFLLDEHVVQQGYITVEPYRIEKEGGFKPVIIPLADYGYNPYVTTIETTCKRVNSNPDLVQRFVDASIQGWYSYLEDPTPGNQLIKQDNPEMTDDLLAFSLSTIKEYEILTAGDAATLGIGAMTEDRWQSISATMREVGLITDQIDYHNAFTLEFVNRGVEFYRAS